jgi:glucose uptake protein
LLSASALLFSPFFVLFFTTFPVALKAGGPSGYFAGSKTQHLLGLAGGILWGAGMLTALMTAIAPRDAQPSALIRYMLSNGALLVAAVWGLLAWHEFRTAGERASTLAIGTMVLFLAGLGLVAFGFSPK